MKYSSLLSATILAVCGSLLAGCAANTNITSNPSGASISLNGAYLGQTPMHTVIKDIFGFGSIYTISATKPGYMPQSMTFQERGLEDANGCIPPQIHFELEAEAPKTAPAPQPKP